MTKSIEEEATTSDAAMVGVSESWPQGTAAKYSAVSQTLEQTQNTWVQSSASQFLSNMTSFKGLIFLCLGFLIKNEFLLYRVIIKSKHM